ncbi:hypothetical protein CBE37_03645 [bacterium TMED277]|nr:MAG: hypothetical protein CBE37_03645 [bacterium TMED277]|tara:strand:- start:30 stop:653 length:624 start_codon:yes stop_codon:yes gene_type:complete
MIKLTYFDFDFWRIDIARLCLGYAKIPYKYNRIVRKDWDKKKNFFPFQQLPVMELNGKIYGHTHSISRFCAIKSGLYENDELKALIIDQVLDWANEITFRIALSIREKNQDKAKKLRQRFIKNDLNKWFGFLDNLYKKSATKNNFFTEKFSLADITAWRIILWFTSGKLFDVPEEFIQDFPRLKSFYKSINDYDKFNKLSEFKEITN